MEHLHTKNTAKIIVIDRFGQGQSIKEVGFRRFVKSFVWGSFDFSRNKGIKRIMWSQIGTLNSINVQSVLESNNQLQIVVKF